MANRDGARKLGLTLLVAYGLAAGLAGCASSKRPERQAGMMVATLPPPNFDGPELAEPVAPPPVAFVPKPVVPTPNYSFTPGIPRDWAPMAKPVAWQWIVIHHSATTTGGAVAFDKMHRAKGWDELGYHFVIGNGTDTRDGQVEVGSRWPRQKWGAHAKTPDNKYNDYGIGICLVGNFDIDRPTAAQVASLSKLVAFLEKTYRITDTNIVGHGQTKATDCPGKFMNVAQIKSMARQALAEAGESTGPLAVTAGGDMLQDAHAGQ